MLCITILTGRSWISELPFSPAGFAAEAFPFAIISRVLQTAASALRADDFLDPGIVRAGLHTANAVDSLTAAGAFESFQDLIFSHFVCFAAMRAGYGPIVLGNLFTGVRDGFYGRHAVFPPSVFVCLLAGSSRKDREIYIVILLE